MKTKQILVLGASLLVTSLGGFPLLDSSRASAEVVHRPVVRLAELVIDPAQLDRYKALLREEIETSIRVEPGVLALYAVSVKDHPEQIRLFEMYASPAAYAAHLQAPHFMIYKAGTQGMVKSLRLLETEPIFLGAKKE